MSSKICLEGNQYNPVYLICSLSETIPIFTDEHGLKFRKLLAKNNFNKSNTLLYSCSDKEVSQDFINKQTCKCVLFVGEQVCDLLEIYYSSLQLSRSNIFEYIYLREIGKYDLFSDSYNIKKPNMITYDYHHVFGKNNLELQNIVTAQFNQDLNKFFMLGKSLVKGILVNGI